MKRRRALLAFPILAAGAVVASIATSPARTYVRPACWNDIRGLLPVPHAGTPYALTDFVFASKHVAGPVHYTIATPHIAFDPARRKGKNTAQAVICLGGRGVAARDVIESVRLHEIAADAVPPTEHAVFIAVDGGESYWHARESGEDRMTMLLDELIPYVQRTFDLRVRAAMGWSMGGYGALLAASRRPDLFAAVAVASPALFRDYETMRRQVPDAFDSSIDFVANDLFRVPGGLMGKPLWIACGDADPFAEASRGFAPPRATVVRTIAPGCHDGGFWRNHVAEQTRFIAHALTV